VSIENYPYKVFPETCYDGGYTYSFGIVKVTHNWWEFQGYFYSDGPLVISIPASP
jgi:hypothetical protein